MTISSQADAKLSALEIVRKEVVADITSNTDSMLKLRDLKTNPRLRVRHFKNHSTPTRPAVYDVNSYLFDMCNIKLFLDKATGTECYILKLLCLCSRLIRLLDFAGFCLADIRVSSHNFRVAHSVSLILSRFILARSFCCLILVSSFCVGVCIAKDRECRSIIRHSQQIGNATHRN